jgi:hypothetical protein
MKIETKFDLDDRVWFIDRDSIQDGIVKQIKLVVSNDGIIVPWISEWYLVEDEKGEALLSEMTAENYFRTRKEAIDELEKRYELNIRRLRAQDKAETNKEKEE